MYPYTAQQVRPRPIVRVVQTVDLQNTVAVGTVSARTSALTEPTRT